MGTGRTRITVSPTNALNPLHSQNPTELLPTPLTVQQVKRESASVATEEFPRADG